VIHGNFWFNAIWCTKSVVTLVLRWRLAERDVTAHHQPCKWIDYVSDIIMWLI